MGSTKQDDRLKEIESNQALLRDNIAESKRLIDTSTRLIEQHRHDLEVSRTG